MNSKERLMKALTNLSLSIGEILYRIKDAVFLIAIVILSNRSGVTVEISLLIGMSILWVLAALRALHRDYIHMIKKPTGKRFTFIDRNGNPSINKEDIPNIIEYLYKLEEENYGRK